MKIYITAIIKSKPEYLAEVSQKLLSMVELARKEQACLFYQLHQDIEDENTFFFYEKWENQEGLDAHNQQPYMQEFAALAQTKLADVPIVVKGHLLK